MSEPIRWAYAGPRERTAVVELLGWCNKSGKATPVGKRIAATSWDKLSPAARRIFDNAGIIEK